MFVVQIIMPKRQLTPDGRSRAIGTLESGVNQINNERRLNVVQNVVYRLWT